MKPSFMLLFAALAFSQALRADIVSLMLTPLSEPVVVGQSVDVVASIFWV